MIKENVTVNNWTQRHKFTCSKKSRGIDQITPDFPHSVQAAEQGRGKLIGGEMSKRQNVLAAKCSSGEMSFGEMSARRNVLAAKCPSSEMSGGEMSGCEMSGGEISGGEMFGHP